jgi:CBS domain-containing protein
METTMQRTVGEIMSRDVVTAPTDTPVREVAQVMARKKISCVVIVGGTKPVGIISERDLVRVVAERPGMLVGLQAMDVMTTPAKNLTAEVTLAEALRAMKQYGFRRFPIVDAQGRIIGLVTQTTILHAISN